MLDLLRDHPKGEPVPAISLRQPWAGAVAYVGKNVENRSRWPFKYRGPMVIHAAAAVPSLEDFDRLLAVARKDGCEEDLLEGLDPRSNEFLDGLFAQGAIVAVARLAEVFGPDDEVPEDHPAHDNPWARDDASYRLYFGEVVPVYPVKFRGAVGMFKVPFEVAARLEQVVPE
jgi:hypothetical protein